MWCDNALGACLSAAALTCFSLFLIISATDQETHTGTLEKAAVTITPAAVDNGKGSTTFSNGAVLPMTGLGSVNDKVDLMCLSNQPSVCILEGRSLDETKTILIDSLNFFPSR